MKLLHRVRRIFSPVPSKLTDLFHEQNELAAVKQLAFDIENLRPAADVDLKTVFTLPETDMRWESAKTHLEMFAIPDGTGGVNPGDRRALYYLVSGLNVTSVLEIGTHIGASTVNIASALAGNSDRKSRSAIRLLSVDITDVNDPVARPWLAYDVACSPLEMLNELGFGSFVEFKTERSLDYLSRSSETFDFIFIDGDHAAKTVYQEVAAALKLLNPRGVILLHDFFPHMRPLWSDGSVLPGPFLAAERFEKERTGLEVVPLGALPWATKLQSNLTSLALVLRNGN